MHCPRFYRVWLVLTMGALLLVGVNPAGADTVAYDVALQTGNQVYTGTFGMDFDVNAGKIITISALGVFDSDGNGIVGTTLYATIYNRTTHLAVTPTISFTTADPGTLGGGSRFKALASEVNLGPGDYAIGAWGYNTSSEPGGNLYVSPPSVTASTMNSANGAISFVGTSRWINTPNTYPTITGNNLAKNSFLAGTFEFVPLPSTVLLLGSGLVGLALLRRRWNLKK